MAIAGPAIGVAGLCRRFLQANHLLRHRSFWTGSPTSFFVRLGVLITVPIAYCLDRCVLCDGAVARFRHASLFIYWIRVEMVYGVVSSLLHKALTFEQAMLSYDAFSLFSSLSLRIFLPPSFSPHPSCSFPPPCPPQLSPLGAPFTNHYLPIIIRILLIHNLFSNLPLEELLSNTKTNYGGSPSSYHPTKKHHGRHPDAAVRGPVLPGVSDRQRHRQACALRGAQLRRQASHRCAAASQEGVTPSKVNWDLLERRIASSEKAYQRQIIRRKIDELVQYYEQCRQARDLPSIPGRGDHHLRREAEPSSPLSEGRVGIGLKVPEREGILRAIDGQHRLLALHADIDNGSRTRSSACRRSSSTGCPKITSSRCS